MANKEKKTYKLSQLPSLARWGVETTNTFETYLSDYQNLPEYKKILHSMIRFSEMYRPLSKRSQHTFTSRSIAGANELRKIKRAQIYMNKKDLIITQDSAQGKKIVVTSRGHKIFYKDYPLAKLRKSKWEGNWTLVMYDFPEKLRTKRDYLRRNLTKMGFGSPQISILISPLPLEKMVSQLLEGQELKEYVWVLTCKKLWGLTNREIAKRSWPLTKLNNLYQSLLKALPKAKEKGPQVVREWQVCFLALATKDPCLPPELLIKDWAGDRCKKKFTNLNPLGPLGAFFKNL